MTIASVNPATGVLLRQFEPLTDDAARARIAVAADAFRLHRQVPLDHRSLCLRKLATLLETETEELALLITTEMGKPIVAARQEVLKCAAVCRFYAEHAPRMLAPESIPTEASASYVRWDPLGVVLAIMPWNFPLWQVFRFLAPALMAGNVALLKHAPGVPQCALAIESLTRRAGFVRGAFQTLLIEASQVNAVIADERVAAVTLTGGEAAGRAVAAQAGWLIKPSVLELGGSDPFIVMPSADLDQAIRTAVRARTINSGQSCIAAKRFLVAASIHAEFSARFVAGMRAMRVGDPLDERTDIGPLAAPHLLDRLEAQIEAAVRAGARVLTGGRRIPGPGSYFEPTVLTGITPDSPVFRDELFGPVAMLFHVQDVDDAIHLSNATQFGLAASVWTRDPAEQQRFVAELECGSVFLNSMVSSDPRLPFGGIKRSGYGRELSAAGLRSFMNCKTVVLDNPVPTDLPR